MGGVLTQSECVTLDHDHTKLDEIVLQDIRVTEGSMQGPLSALGQRCNHSWLQELRPDPDTNRYKPNKISREVKSGHYVLVTPAPLPDPYLVAVSLEMAQVFGLSEDDCKTEQFVRFFSGDISVASGFVSWATPYALSIYGKEMTRNCPFGNGNGYGDGRAISVGEVVTASGRWELQLKGGGTTPFCRGADGRAVLRSSIREFIASEAMHQLGVATTRALALVASKSESIRRPWYSDNAPPWGGTDPDTLVKETCAITCRVAPSFLRVGHVELFGRRARQGDKKGMKELELIVLHLLSREYSDVDDPTRPLQERILIMLAEFSKRLARLVADWIRVGFCQGNFNSDNCLAAGRTMDYGPFGFMELYNPGWCMWTGGQGHYSFINQPAAAAKNFASFCLAINPLLDASSIERAKAIYMDFDRLVQEALADVFRRKLGLRDFTQEGMKLYTELDSLMQESSVDYTIFWRQLARLPELSDKDSLDLIAPLQDAFYTPLDTSKQVAWSEWSSKWLTLLSAQGVASKEAAALMRSTSPKYVAREWMLVEAYAAAQMGDNSVVAQIQQVLSLPYEEQPEFEDKYFRKAAATVLKRGGVAFMS